MTYDDQIATAAKENRDEMIMKVGIDMALSQSKLFCDIMDVAAKLKTWEDYSIDIDDARRINKFKKLLAIENKALTEYYGSHAQNVLPKDARESMINLIESSNNLLAQVSVYVAGWQLHNGTNLY